MHEVLPLSVNVSVQRNDTQHLLLRKCGESFDTSIVKKLSFSDGLKKHSYKESVLQKIMISESIKRNAWLHLIHA